MTFAAKYEILETVTAGAVETFVARKVATDERVVVHVFDAGEQPKQQPTVQWVLQAFGELAPGPCSTVLDTGRYGDTSYAYLVTKLPEKAVLQAWIQSYEAKSPAEEAIAPIPSGPAASAPEPTTPSAETRPATWRTNSTPENEPPEELTQAFEALKSKLRPAISTNHFPSSVWPEAEARGDVFTDSAAPAAPGEQPEAPGDFTKQFFPAATVREGKPSLAADLGSAEESPGLISAVVRHDPHAETDPNGIAREFELPPSYPPGSTPSKDPSPPGRRFPLEVTGSSNTGKAAGPGTGEFTEFFRGPFDGQRAAETPEIPVGATRREERETGEFTKVFGRAKSDPSGRFRAVSDAKANAAAAPESGSFERWFGEAEAPKTGSNTKEPAWQPSDRFGDSSSRPVAVNATPPSSPPSSTFRVSAERPAATPAWDKGPPSGGDSSFPMRPDPDGATRAFSPLEREPSPDFSKQPAGPSQYTRIISGGLKNAIPPEEPSWAAPPGSAAPPVSAPTPPIVPPAPQWQPPAPPPMPAAPQIPVAPAPQIPAVAPPSTIPWAMILILNGLFILAVLLVVYFLLKR